MAGWAGAGLAGAGGLIWGLGLVLLGPSGASESPVLELGPSGVVLWVFLREFWASEANSGSKFLDFRLWGQFGLWGPILGFALKAILGSNLGLWEAICALVCRDPGRPQRFK